MKGLAPHTQQIFEAVSKLDCIKPYLLVGGTALSLQIGTRQSEDLDLQSFFKPIAQELESKQDSIRAEFNNTQGNKVDLGGYYKFDDSKAEKVMRPSSSFNAIIERIAKG